MRIRLMCSFPLLSNWMRAKARLLIKKKAVITIEMYYFNYASRQVFSVGSFPISLRCLFSIGRGRWPPWCSSPSRNVTFCVFVVYFLLQDLEELHMEISLSFPTEEDQYHPDVLGVREIVDPDNVRFHL
eukprot:751347-Hanusia_phi.AAC.3